MSYKQNLSGTARRNHWKTYYNASDCEDISDDEGSFCGSPPISSPMGTPPIGSPIGTPPIGSPMGTPPIGSPIGTPPIGSPMGSPPIGSPMGTPPLGSRSPSPTDEAIANFRSLSLTHRPYDVDTIRNNRSWGFATEDGFAIQGNSRGFEGCLDGIRFTMYGRKKGRMIYRDKRSGTVIRKGADGSWEYEDSDRHLTYDPRNSSDSDD